MPDVERAHERTPLIHNRAVAEQEAAEANSSAFFSGIGEWYSVSKEWTRPGLFELISALLCTLSCCRVSALDPNASGFPSAIAGIPEEDEDTPAASAVKLDTDERRSDICV